MLGNVEQFFLEMCSIPRLSFRLEAVAASLTFESARDDVAVKLRLVRGGLDTVLASTTLPSLLEYVHRGGEEREKRGRRGREEGENRERRERERRERERDKTNRVCWVVVMMVCCDGCEGKWSFVLWVIDSSFHLIHRVLCPSNLLFPSVRLLFPSVRLFSLSPLLSLSPLPSLPPPSLSLPRYVLAIGNHMNGESNRGGAWGFKLETLDKLDAVKSTDNKQHLVHFLVKEIEVREKKRRRRYYF